LRGHGREKEMGDGERRRRKRGEGIRRKTAKEMKKSKCKREEDYLGWPS
jgi:hypothetical protein